MNRLFDTGEGQRRLMDYQARGFRLLPVDIDKRPLCKWTKFTATAQTFTETWAAFSNKRCAGVAVNLGASGLVCRDYDTPESYAAFQSRYPVEAAMLPTARTARGFHVYARWDGPTKTTILADGEIRGAAAYCVLPPSIHSSGNVYRWVVQLPEIGKELPTVSADVFLGVKPDWGELLAESDALSSAPAPTPPVQHYLTVEHPRNVEHPAKPILCSNNADFESGKFADFNVWQSCIPDGYGKRNDCILRLVRHLKTIDKFKAVNDPEYLRSGFLIWHSQALKHIRTKDFGLNFRQFCRAWICYRGHKHAIEAVIDVARTKPPIITADPALNLLALVCEFFASQNKNGNFFMGTLTASAIIGRGHSIAGTRALRKLQNMRLIRLVRRGKRPRASTFKWLGGAK